MPETLSTAVAHADGIRRDVLAAAEAALLAAEPSALVRRKLKVQRNRLNVGGQSLDLDSFRRVVVVGGGKASALMAAAVERALGERIDDGLVIVPDYQRGLPRLRKVRFAKSTHPLPSGKGEGAVREMLRVLDGVGAGDLVVAVLSGGGSALMPYPLEGVSVKEMALTTDLLLKAGTDIRESNCVRKHLSRISGGRLVERANGADVLALLISDVVGDDLGSIASGPTTPDPTTFLDARRVLEDRGIWKKVPISVRRVIAAGVSGSVEETPKPGSRLFDRVNNLIVGSNADACSAAKRALESRGFRAALKTGVTGEARVVGRDLARLALSRRAHRWAVVWGGETTVTVAGKGVGGRNQEAALAAAIELEGSSGVALACFGTDGVDGPTDSAGAVVDGTTLGRGLRRGLDAAEFLRNSDSHTFFKALGDLIFTGPTGTNVNDVMIAAGG